MAAPSQGVCAWGTDASFLRTRGGGTNFRNVCSSRDASIGLATWALKPASRLLLFIYQRERGADDFTDRIMELAGGVSRYFPNYLKSPAEYYETLTETEKKVLRLMALGMSNDEIAERMGRKAGTVKFHSNSIFRKLRVSNRQQAVNRGRGIGLL